MHRNLTRRRRERDAKHRLQLYKQVLSSLSRSTDSDWQALKYLLQERGLETNEEGLLLAWVTRNMVWWSKVSEGWMTSARLIFEYLDDVDREALREWVLSCKERPTVEGPAAAARWIIPSWRRRMDRDGRVREHAVSYADGLGAALADPFERLPVQILLAREMLSLGDREITGRFVGGLVRGWMEGYAAEHADRASRALCALGIDEGKTRAVTLEHDGFLHLVNPRQRGHTVCSVRIEGKPATRMDWEQQTRPRCGSCEEGFSPVSPDFENGPSFPIGIPRLDKMLWDEAEASLYASLDSWAAGKSVRPDADTRELEAEARDSARYLDVALQRMASSAWPEALTEYASRKVEGLGRDEVRRKVDERLKKQA